MTTAYLVSSGEYSDYSVRFVTLSREMAEVTCERLNRGEYDHYRGEYDHYRVEERPLIDEALDFVEVLALSWDRTKNHFRPRLYVTTKQDAAEWETLEAVRVGSQGPRHFNAAGTDHAAVHAAAKQWHENIWEGRHG